MSRRTAIGGGPGTGERPALNPADLSPWIPPGEPDVWEPEQSGVRGRHAAGVDLARPDAPAAPATVISGDVRVRSHERAGARRGAWAELSDIQFAIRRSRAGHSDVVGLLAAVRPERAMSRVAWSPSIRHEDLITSLDIEELANRYRRERVAKLPEEERRVWANRVGMELFDATERIDPGYDSKRRIYGMEVVSRLVAMGLLESGSDRALNSFLDDLEEYDELLQERQQVRQDIAAHKLRSAGTGVLRFALGIPIAAAIRKPAQLAYTALLSRRGRTVISSEDAHSSRNFANRFAGVSLVAVALGGVTFYRTTGGELPFLGGGEEQEVAAQAPSLLGPDATETPDTLPPGSEIEPPPALPDSPPVEEPPAVPEFEQGAYVTSAGEGWIQQFDQMGLNYSHDFMDNGTGEWLERQGYAYLHYDPSSGTYDWRMNYKNISPSVLAELHQRASAAGLAQ